MPEPLPRSTLSRIDEKYDEYLSAFIEEAREGPRLFSLVPVDRQGFDPRTWVRARFRLTLWCEHSHLPLPMLNADRDEKKGICEIEFDREGFKIATPFLKLVNSTLSLVLRMPSSVDKLAVDAAAYRAYDEQLDFGKSMIDAVIGEGTKIEGWMGTSGSVYNKKIDEYFPATVERSGRYSGEFLVVRDPETGEYGQSSRRSRAYSGEFLSVFDPETREYTVAVAENAILHEFQALIKAKDPGFGGLVRVMNKRQEFLWVHPQFEGEY
jgi:hypothetical protein